MSRKKPKAEVHLRADWEVTIISGDPKWCELFLILYRTHYSTKLKVKEKDGVTFCLFRIFTVTAAKHLVILKVLEYSCVVIFAKQTAQRKQQLQRRYAELVIGHYLSIVYLICIICSYFNVTSPGH